MWPRPSGLRTNNPTDLLGLVGVISARTNNPTDLLGHVGVISVRTNNPTDLVALSERFEDS